MMVPVELVYVLVAIIAVLVLTLIAVTWRSHTAVAVEALYGLIDFARTPAAKTPTPYDDMGVDLAERIADAVLKRQQEDEMFTAGG